MEQDAAIRVAVRQHPADASFLVASHEGQGFVVSEDDCVGNTRKGQAGAERRDAERSPARIATVTGGHRLPVIGTNHKMVLFPIDQVPEMAAPGAAGVAACRSTPVGRVVGCRHVSIPRPA